MNLGDILKNMVTYVGGKCWKDIISKKISLNRHKVGIIDGPINKTLIKNITDIATFCSSDTDDSLDCSHASAVSLIINNINPANDLFLAQVFPDDGEEATPQNVLRALDWLVNEKKVDIINMSLGFYNHCSGKCKWDERIECIKKEHEVTIIVSGGNKRNDDTLDSITSPGCSPEVITVGGLNEELDIDSSMNVEPITDKPEIYANGCINFCVNDYEFKRCGTSFSAPIITGLVSKYYLFTDSESQFGSNVEMLFKNVLVYVRKYEDTTFIGNELNGIKQKISERYRYSSLKTRKNADIINFLKTDLELKYPR